MAIGFQVLTTATTVPTLFIVEHGGLTQLGAARWRTAHKSLKYSYALYEFAGDCFELYQFNRRFNVTWDIKEINKVLQMHLFWFFPQPDNCCWQKVWRLNTVLESKI